MATPHRGEAYEASRYIIEELKARLPIWKREHYLDGETQWVGGAGAAETDGGATEVSSGAGDGRRDVSLPEEGG